MSKAGGVFITGSSSGIGEACALELNKLGFEVFAGVREVKDSQSLRQKASGRSMKMDLSIFHLIFWADIFSRLPNCISSGIRNDGPLRILAGSDRYTLPEKAHRFFQQILPQF